MVIGAAPCHVLIPLPIGPPAPRKSRDPIVKPVKSENHQIGMSLLQLAPLIATLGRFSLQPASQRTD